MLCIENETVGGSIKLKMILSRRNSKAVQRRINAGRPVRKTSSRVYRNHTGPVTTSLAISVSDGSFIFVKLCCIDIPWEIRSIWDSAPLQAKHKTDRGRCRKSGALFKSQADHFDFLGGSGRDLWSPWLNPVTHIPVSTCDNNEFEITGRWQKCTDSKGLWQHAWLRLTNCHVLQPTGECWTFQPHER